MGFGGGAFGTGSYTWNVIDDETIKLNQQKGVIYANQSALAPSVDNNTIYLNSSNQLAVKPSVITQSTSNPQNNIVISSNTTLANDLYCNNLTINSGVVLTTNGYNIYCSGTFTNNGTIITGTITNLNNLPNSYGGSGGGGGAEYYSSNGSLYNGTNGISTLVSGGVGATASSNGTGTPAGNGSTPSAPTITNSLIQSWHSNGFQNYLSGGSGGYCVNYNNGGGSYGIYIQANQIIAGTINANGGNGQTINGVGGGGGGGGVILLAYGSGGYTAGTYNVSGGTGGTTSGFTVNENGGNGGAGQVLTYNYGSTPPIPMPNVNYTYSSISGIKNINSSYNYSPISTNQTSPQTIISQIFTPKYTGLVKIKAVVQVWNNTANDGVFVGIYNGSTELDSNTFTSTSANLQGLIELYSEVLYSAPFSQQTFSIQFNAVSGGFAYAEIQEFTIEEVY